MRITAIVTAALTALSLTACVEVKEPIGSSVGYVDDPALEGTWRGEAGDDRGENYYHVLPNDDGTMTVVGYAPKGPKDKASWGTMTLTTVALGPNHYMNAVDTGEDGGPPKNQTGPKSIPLLYTIKGDTLSLFTLDRDKVIAAIRAGKIEGKITSEKMSGMTIDSVAITADGSHLDAFMKRADAADLFAPVFEMHR